MKRLLLCSLLLLHTPIQSEEPSMMMKIESPAFAAQQKIPKKYTCEGEDHSPPLTFSGVPAQAKSLALIVDDPDAKHGTFDHWIAWNLPPTTNVLAEGAFVPRQGINGFGQKHYRGPCPPPGAPHRYFFKLYALDALLTLPESSSKEDLEKAMEGHILMRAELVGLYQR
jgi:Raf kinase inhibitor-like YbhB/YbcL family protein